MTSPSEGLRGRRRLRTRREIHAVALRLAREHGLRKVTVDMISAEAGVSPRTFFNYFPSKEAAFLPVFIGLSPALAAEFAASGAAPARQVLEDLTLMLVRNLIDSQIRREEMHDIDALAAATRHCSPGCWPTSTATSSRSPRRSAGGSGSRLMARCRC